MALDLGHPGQLMATIMASMEDRTSDGNSEAAEAITKGLPLDSIKTLLKYLRQWNTSPPALSCGAACPAILASQLLGTGKH